MDTGGSSWSGVVNWMTSSYISTSGTLLRVLIVKEECRAAIIAVAANAMSRVGGSVSRKRCALAGRSNTRVECRKKLQTGDGVSAEVRQTL